MKIRRSSRKSSDRFLITGCQRSGTTLVAMVLEAHPLIEMIEENDTRFHTQGSITLELDLEAIWSQAAPARGMVRFKAPRDSHRADEIAKMGPGIRILWVEREIHQVVASMLNLQGADGSWAAVFAPRELSKYIAISGDERARKLFAQARFMKDERAKAIAFAALCWRVKLEQRRSAVDRYGTSLLRVDYDELVTDTEHTLRRVLDFLHLEWNSQVLHHPASIGQVARPGEADADRPVDERSKEKWHATLSQADLDVIARVERSFQSIA